MFKHYIDLATSVSVLDEVVFVYYSKACREDAWNKGGLIGYAPTYAPHGVSFAASKLEELVELLEALDIVVLQDYSSPRELL